jgi:hypothetical protein
MPSDRDLLALIIVLLVGALTAYRFDLSEGVISVTLLWAAYTLGRSHPPPS